MALNTEQIQQLVKSHYGLDVRQEGEQQNFDASNMTTITNGETHVSNKGHLEAYELTAAEQKLVLVAYDGDLVADEELITWIKDTVWGGQQKLQEIKANEPLNNYYLFSIIE